MGVHVLSGQSAVRQALLRNVTLEDKYDLDHQHVFLSGTQAVVRMLLMQRERDRLAGLNTAGFISGYRGSPLGGLDQNFLRAKAQFDRANIRFEPGLNEDLAATAVWGAQQAEMRGEGRYDGVFSVWYGKGPGVDRCGDVFRHANLAGTSKYGGVLALMGDDHTAESSTTAHQSEFHFLDLMVPILNPAGVQEILDYGLFGFAMSRFCGTWAALKCVKDNIESTASVDGALSRIRIIVPDDFTVPPGGLSIRPRDNILEQEARLHEFKRAAAVAFIRANNLNHLVTTGGQNPKIGIITTGKSYLDVRQAFEDLGIDEAKANQFGIRLYKLACPWPLSQSELKTFADRLDLIMVVEEKRSLIEVQVREELYGTANQPTVIGKRDEHGEWLFPVKGALDPNDIAIALGERLLVHHRSDDLAGRVARLKAAQKSLGETFDIATRTPYFCSGCPHNTSTKVPEGMRAYAGIGCHYMVQWMERGTEGFTQMGGEGANWIGEAAFSTRNHVFQNLGDGTYNHSGALAIRWAIATKTNVTYKILFNDAVAMTGGQSHEGNLTPDSIARQIRAEGIERIAIVTDEPEKYDQRYSWPAGASFHHRSELGAVQQELAGIPGVTAMIYDQTCAAEKRRRRKRGLMPDPDQRVLINELVCEGCGDCGKASNCVSVQPVETEFGRKRRIDQSNCNKDFSCLDGFCPSFVTVSGARPKRLAGHALGLELPELTEPVRPDLDKAPFAVIITGVGGTGVVTIGAILGMAAHLEHRGCGMIDMAGLAQKGGAVYSHVRLAKSPEDIHSIRVSAGMADLVLGCDLVVSGSKKVLTSTKPGETLVVVNTAEVLPGDFTRNPDYSLPAERLKRGIASAAGQGKAHFIDAQKIAITLFGQSIAANMFLLGFAYQKGGIPLSASALERAIALNGEAVGMNTDAFRWGRAVAQTPQLAAEIAGKRQASAAQTLSTSLEELVARRTSFLTDYQNAAYARRFSELVARASACEQAVVPQSTALTEAVARALFRVMAYKDEYEVARLFTAPAFRQQISDNFEGEGLSLTFHLAPPLVSRSNPSTGLPMKRRFGPWMMKAFGLLARLKGLRGTAFDPFGYTPERKDERARIEAYFERIDELLGALSPDNLALAVEIANVPLQIRGFGHVRAKAAVEADAREHALLARFRAGDFNLAEAAE
ncbi:COG4231 Indolepyruvate ferredoxin oxidoreductase, alpha and beta subunits [Rhabdaerophilaceae bacterium]